MNDVVVMKFGGTSVGSAERMRAAARLAADERKERPVAVVVSAMSKITDLLLDTMRHAEAGDRAGMEANLATLRARHERKGFQLKRARKQVSLDLGRPTRGSAADQGVRTTTHRKDFS